MGSSPRLIPAGLFLLAWTGAVLADEPMNGTFRASRSCEALLSIRKGTNPGAVSVAPGAEYALLARNQKKATHFRIEVPGAQPPERWVAAACGEVLAAGAPTAPENPKRSDLSYVLALSWQPAFCETNMRKPECRSQSGRRPDATSLSLHGLWPQPSSLEYCNVPAGVRAAGEDGRWRDIPDIPLSLATRTDLETMMPGSQSMLERHEWAKHGSCYPANAEAYFRDSLRLLKEVNASPVADLLRASVGRRVTAADIRAAFDQGFGSGAGNRVRVTCMDVGERRLIAEITISLKGDIPAGTRLSGLVRAAEPTGPGCPAGEVDAVGTH